MSGRSSARSLLAVAGLGLVLGSATAADALMVSAAASLRDAVEHIARSFEDETGEAVRCNFAGSGLLRRQIESLAPVDVFVSAGWREIERLEANHLVSGDPLVVARNRLVLIVPADSSWRGRSAHELLSSPDVTRIATGDPDGVPFGNYARSALTRSGLWDDLKGRMVFATNVRQALDYAERGAVDAAIVYATDARLAKQTALVGEVPGSGALRIESVAVRITKSVDPVAGRFLDYLVGDAGQRALRDYGFYPPTP